jgi:hypothetical protein
MDEDYDLSERSSLIWIAAIILVGIIILAITTLAV